MAIQATNAILIAGPTASGKSALALELAEQTGGVVVNTDSMQVYDILHVLTARPGRQETDRAPHVLYGHIHPSRNYSAASWYDDVRKLLESGEFGGRPMIFTGGTGLYFRALVGGLSDMPEIKPEIRERWRYRLAEEGAGKLHRMLRQIDPESAAAIKAGDGQRIVRALEVMEATGKPIAHWRNAPGVSLVKEDGLRKILVMPERELLARRIERRFEAMVARGALEEVRNLMRLELQPTMPAMKAIGVRELGAVLTGNLDLDEAMTLAIAATRQYAKRQMTWFRNQAGSGWEIHI